jgi:hypothetical protein
VRERGSFEHAGGERSAATMHSRGEAVFDCDRFVKAWETPFHKTKLADIVVVYEGCLQIE